MFSALTDNAGPGGVKGITVALSLNGGPHGCCGKKLPIPNSSDIEAFPDFKPGKQYPVRSAPRPPIPATLARAMTSAQYQWGGSQPQHSKLVKPAPRLRKNQVKCSATLAHPSYFFPLAVLPVPVTPTNCGLVGSLSLMTSVAFFAPVVSGSKVTPMTQLVVILPVQVLLAMV
jgi:hypothetical protein